MARKIYLKGEMSSKFGTVHSFVGDTVQDALRCIDVNNPGFRPYLLKCHQEDIGLSITVQDREIGSAIECLLPYKEGDIVISPIPAGSKSGGAKILAAIAITALMFTPFGSVVGPMGPQLQTSLWGMSQATTAGTMANLAGMAAVTTAANLAITGIQQLMAPDPAVDKEEEKGYMLSGSLQNIVEGDPIPVLYGELRVPGRPISFEVSNTNRNLFVEAQWRFGRIQSKTVPSGWTGGINSQADYDIWQAANQEGFNRMDLTNVGQIRQIYGKSQQIYITDLISEGPIKGLAGTGGSNSVYLNDDTATEYSHSSANLMETEATFDLTENSDIVTFDAGTSGYTFEQSFLTDGTAAKRYIDIVDFRVETITPGSNGHGAAEVIYLANLQGMMGLRISGPLGLFAAPVDLYANASTQWDTVTNVYLTQEIDGDEVTVFEGVIHHIANTGVAQLKHDGHGSLPPGWDADWDPTADFKVHMDFRVRFIVNTSNQLELTGGDWAYASISDVSANITGIELSPRQIDGGVGTPTKHIGFAFDFLKGTRDQVPTDNKEGLGWGVTAVAQGSTFTSASHPIDGVNSGNASSYEFRGTSSAGFGCSATQAAEADELRILFQYAAMFNKRDGSDRDQDGKAFYTVDICFDRGDGFESYETYGGYTSERPLRHIGLSKSQIAAELVIPLDLPGYKPFIDFKVKITRLSDANKAYYNQYNNDDQAGDDYTTNTTCEIKSLTTILKENLSYPYTAMAKVSINTKSFSSPPKRTYWCKGLLIKVPSNYVTRDEDGGGVANYRRVDKDTIHATEYQDWDGSFRAPVYTNNPAWIFYDILINNRYGLGHWLEDTDIDKYALYRIARYCDELVPNGDGGFEPRFTCNVYFQKATDAYKVLKDLATVFRGMLYWLDGNIFPILDEPKEPVYNFTAGNVIDGAFSYESTGSKTRSNQVSVTWVNPDQDYKQEALLVEDKESILSSGKIITQKASAFGATSEGQALRYGRWKLWTAKNQTEVVSFSTSIGAAFLAPGDVVNIQDASRSPAKIQYSGRISSTGTLTALIIPLDRKIALLENSTYELSVLIEQPAVFLTQETAVIEGVTYSKGNLLEGEYTETEALNIIQTDGSSAAILGSVEDEPYYQEEQPVTVAWQPHTRVESQPVDTSFDIDITSLEVTTAFSEIPNVQTIWALKETTGGVVAHGSKKAYKILSISENDSKYNITAVEHYNEKFTELDEDFVLSVPDPVLTGPQGIPPAPRNVYCYTYVRDGDERKNDAIFQWDAPLDENGDLYQYVAGYEIEHNVPIIDSPFIVSEDTHRIPGADLEPGSYTLEVRTINTAGDRSPYVATTFTIEEGAAQGGVDRHYGIPLGGAMSRNVFLSDTTHNFRVTFAAYKIASAGSLLTFVTPTTGTDNHVQDCSDIESITYTNPLYSDVDKKLLSHYVFFDASDTSDHLKLIRYTKDATLKIDYWYDTDDGDGTPASNFILTGAGSPAGTVEVEADSTDVKGTSTTFETDYEIGSIIYFTASIGAIVTDIISDTAIKIDRSFTTAIAASSNHSPNKFKFDYDADAIIATVRNNGGTFELTSHMTVDQDLNDSPFVATFYADPPQLVFDGEDPPVLKSGQDATIDLVVEAEGFQNPEFKITGAGFDHTDLGSDSPDASFTNNGTKTYTRTLSAISTHSDTSLAFTANIRETDNPTQILQTRAKGVLVPFIKDGEDGGTGGTGATGPAGLNTGTPTLFQVNNSNSTPPSDPTGVSGLTYTFATGLVTEESGQSGNLNGWTNTRPDTSETNPYRWVIIGPASSSTASDIIAYGDWAAPVLDSAEGYQSATVYLYQRNNTGSSSPALPTSDLTYTFSSKALSGGSLNGWSQTIPGTGDYIHVTTAIALAVNSDLSDVIEGEPDGDWSDAVILAQPGATGSSVNIVFKRAATIPPRPGDANYQSSGVPSGWSDSPPSGTDLLWASRGEKPIGETLFTWTLPFQIEGEAHAEVYIYSLNDDTAPSGGSYNFVTNTLTVPTSNSNQWQRNVPSISSNGDEVYVSVGLASGANTATAATVAWGTVALYAVRTDGDEGDGVDIIFRRSTTVLTTAPDASPGLPDDWYTDVDSVPSMADSLMYSSVGTRLAGATNWIWQVPIQIEGSDGVDGISIAELTIYQRSGTTLTSSHTPTAATYTFQTGVLASIGDWSRNIPESDGDPLYASATVASITGATGTDSSLTWSDPVLSMMDAVEGDPGVRTSVGYLYHIAQSNGDAPTGPDDGEITWATGAVTANNGWSTTSPAITGGAVDQKMYYVYYTVIQDDSDDATTDLTSSNFGGVTLGTNFVGLVKFDSANKIVDGNSNLLHFGQGGSTLIDGDVITTGVIKSDNYSGTVLDGTVYSGGGTLFDVDDGIIVSQEFKIDGDGNASFKGNLSAATGSFEGMVTAEDGFIGGWALSDGYISSTPSPYTSTGYSSAGITLNDAGSIHAPNFALDTDGKMTAREAIFTGSIETGSTVKATSINLRGTDKVVMGENASITLGTTGGTSNTYTCVLAVQDLGDSAQAAIIGVGQAIGIAGRPGVYGDSGASPQHWGWLGHTSAGVFTSSLKLHGWDAPLAHSTSNESKFLRGDGEWADVSGSGTVTSITFSGGLSSTQAPLTTTGTVSIAPLGVTLAKMATNSVDSDQYVDGSIDNVHLAANSVDSDQYVDGSIDNAHLAANSVDSAQYVDGSIDAEHLANDSIDEASLKVDNGPTNDYVLTAKSSAAGGLTWAEGGSGGGLTAINLTNNAHLVESQFDFQAGKYLKVNSGEDALEFTSGTGGGADGYLSAVSRPSGTNNILFTVTDASNITFTGFGANAFNSTAFTTNTGTTTHNNTQEFTNKSGDISQWTNDVGYVTSSGGGGTVTGTGANGNYAKWTSSTNIEGKTPAQVLSDIGAAAASHGDHLSLGTGSGNAYRADRALIAYNHSAATHAPTNAAANVQSNWNAASGDAHILNKPTIPTNNTQLANGAGYTTNTGTTTASNTQTFTNKSGSNLQWTNAAGYTTNTGTTTASNTQTFTNKSGSNNQWTNDKGYITSFVNTVTSLNAGGGAYTGALTFNGNAVSQSGTTFTFTDTNTTYTVGDGGLSQKNFTTALYNKLNDGQSVKTSDSVTFAEVTASSDIRLKTDVKTIDNALEKVSDMRGVTFNRAEGPSSGVIAQELEKVAPELVKDGKFKSVAYGNLVGYLIEAIKELKDKVEELENGNSSN